MRAMHGCDGDARFVLTEWRHERKCLSNKAYGSKDLAVSQIDQPPLNGLSHLAARQFSNHSQSVAMASTGGSFLTYAWAGALALLTLEKRLGDLSVHVPPFPRRYIWRRFPTRHSRESPAQRYRSPGKYRPANSGWSIRKTALALSTWFAPIWAVLYKWESANKPILVSLSCVPVQPRRALYLWTRAPLS